MANESAQISANGSTQFLPQNAQLFPETTRSPGSWYNGANPRRRRREMKGYSVYELPVGQHFC